MFQVTLARMAKAATLAMSPAARLARRRIRLGPGSYYFKPPRILVYAGDPGHVVTVGAYTSIAEDVTFFIGGEHRTSWLSTYPFPGARARGHPVSHGPIVIGSDVWIGAGATIRSGVTIGDGAVVAACALVADDVDAFTIVGGVPARALRRRFDPATIALLLRLRWWDWPYEAIVRAQPALLASDAQALAELAPDCVDEAGWS